MAGTKLKAIDGCTFTYGGLTLPVPVGTELVIYKGGLINSGSETNGNYTSTNLQAVTTGKIEGIVVRIDDIADKEAFYANAASEKLPGIITQGSTTYSTPVGTLISPDEGKTIGFNPKNLTTEAFVMESNTGKVVTVNN